MDKAVNAVFAALIWHSQEIREEVVPLGEWQANGCAGVAVCSLPSSHPPCSASGYNGVTPRLHRGRSHATRPRGGTAEAG